MHCVAKVWYFDHKTISRLFWRAFVGQQTIRLIQWWLSRNALKFVWKFCSPRLSWLSTFSKLQHIQLSFFNFYDLLWTPPWWTSSSWDFHWNQLDSTCELLPSKSGDSIMFQVIVTAFIMSIQSISRSISNFKPVLIVVNWVVVSLFNHRYLASTLYTKLQTWYKLIKIEL